MPPPQSKEEDLDDSTPECSADVRSDPSKAISEEIGDADAMVEPSWIFGNDGDADDDEEED